MAPWPGAVMPSPSQGWVYRCQGTPSNPARCTTACGKTMRKLPWSCRFWGKRCGEQDLFWFKQWKTTDFDWFGWIWTMQNQSFPEVSYNSSWTTTSWLQPPRARLGLAWVRWSTWHTWVKTSSRMVETLPVGRFQPMAIATPEKWTVIDCNA